MDKFITYGTKTINLVLVHGGPGARGSLKDLATMISSQIGVLEINQSKLTIDELIEEMKDCIEKNCDNKVVLLGHSWGAWLVCLFAHKYPEYVRKILLVSSGCFEEKYVEKFNKRRMSRLNIDEKQLFDVLMKDFTSDDLSIKDEVMGKFGELMGKLDTYDYEENEYFENGKPSFEMYNSIWSEASNLRRTGELLNITKKITVPIHIIQGEYDSHSLDGIIEPFDINAIDYTFDLLEKCGHYPWREKRAKMEFIDIIKKELE